MPAVFVIRETYPSDKPETVAGVCANGIDSVDLFFR